MLIGADLPEPLIWWNDLEFPAALSICGGFPPFCQGYFGEIYVGLEFDIAGELHYGWVLMESFALSGHIMRLAYESEPGEPNISTTRLYDRRRSRAEDSPTFKIAY